MPDESKEVRGTARRTGAAVASPPIPAFLRGVPGVVHVAGGIWDVTLTGLGLSWVGPYDELRKYMKARGLPLEAAHIVGREHLLDLHSKIRGDKAPSVGLEPRLHKLFSKLVLDRQKQELAGRATATHHRAVYGKGAVIALYHTVYEGIPELTRMVQNTLEDETIPVGKEKGPAGASRVAAEATPPVSQRGTSNRRGARPLQAQNNRPGFGPAAPNAAAAIGRGLSLVGSLIPAAQGALNRKNIREDYESKREIVRALRARGLWVAVFAIYDTPRDRDVLRRIDPTIDEIAIGVGFQTGLSREEAVGTPIPRYERPNSGQPRRSGRKLHGEGRRELIDLLPPFDFRVDDKSILGRYVVADASKKARQDEFPLERQIVVTKGNREAFEAEFRSLHADYRGIRQTSLIAVVSRKPSVQSYDLHFVEAGEEALRSPNANAVRDRIYASLNATAYHIRSELTFKQASGHILLIERYVGYFSAAAARPLLTEGNSGWVIWRKVQER